MCGDCHTPSVVLAEHGSKVACIGWAVLAIKRKGWGARGLEGISEAKVGAHGEKINRWDESSTRSSW